MPSSFASKMMGWDAALKWFRVTFLAASMVTVTRQIRSVLVTWEDGKEEEEEEEISILSIKL